MTSQSKSFLDICDKNYKTWNNQVAYHPNCPDENAPAPGSQIVSTKISDNTIGTSTTAKAGIRVLRACIQSGVSLGKFSKPLS